MEAGKDDVTTTNSAVSFFNVFITGQMKSATFPLGPDSSEIFCRYEIIAGTDWELVSGFKCGITQTASNSQGNFNEPIVFNMPLEWTYRSTNPFGWPQLLICIYGKTFWGVETSLGYSRIHTPTFGSGFNQVINTPILRPRCSNFISEFARWLTGRNPELRDPKFLLDNTKSKELSFESYGEIQLVLNVISRGIGRLGLEY